MNNTSATGTETRNLMLAILLATVIYAGWQYFYERPLLAAKQAEQAKQEHVVDPEKTRSPAAPIHDATPVTDATANAPRIAIRTPSLHGSISLVGARFDELTLANFRETQNPDSPEVKLLNRANTPDAYFIELGVLPESDQVNVPTATTIGKAKIPSSPTKNPSPSPGTTGRACASSAPLPSMKTSCSR